MSLNLSFVADSAAELGPTAGRPVNVPDRSKSADVFIQEQFDIMAEQAYTPFFISDSILTTPALLQSRSRLLQLPAELQLLIIEQLQIPYFQVIFALTCKRLASLLAANTSRMTRWRGFRDKEGLYRLLKRRGRDYTLAIPPGIGPPILNPLPPYVPEHLRLCRGCFRFVPRRHEYWDEWFPCHNIDLKDPNAAWGDVANFFHNQNRDDGQHKCPECCIRKNDCFMSERQWLRALIDDRVEGTYDESDGEDRPRVKSGLERRMWRP